MRKLGLIPKLAISLQAIVLIAYGFLFFSMSSLHAASTFVISGHVTDQNGTGIQNVAITATDPGTNTVEFGPINTDSTGAYSLSVLQGTYDLHFTPPTGSNFNAIIQTNVTISGDQTINVQLTPVTRTVSGTVTDKQGNPLPNVFVNARLPSDTIGNPNLPHGGAATDNNGHFAISLPANVYALTISSGTSSLPNSSIKTNVQVDLTNADAIQNFQLPLATTVQVLVKDNTGNAAASRQVTLNNTFDTSVLSDRSGNASIAEHGEATTDASGIVNVPIYQDASLPAGSICASLPTGSICNADPITVTNTPVSVVLAAPVTRTVSGTVTDATGNPIAGLSVSLSVGIGSPGSPHGSATTDTSGRYSMNLAAAAYDHAQIFLAQNGGTAGFNARTNVTIDATNGDATQDFKLPFTVNPTTTLHVDVKDNTGNLVGAGQIVSLGTTMTSSLLPDTADTATISLFGAAATNTNGRADIAIFSGASIATGGLCTQLAGNNICNQSAIQIGASDQIIELAAPVTRTFSGAITDSQGSPVAGVNITAWLASDTVGNPNSPHGAATTDSQGHFSMNLSPNIYAVSLFMVQESMTMNVKTSFQADLTTGDVSQNFVLPPTTVITVVVKDIQGNPIVGQQVTYATNDSFSLGNGITTIQRGISGQAATNGLGAASLRVVQGLSFAPGAICTTFSGNMQCNTIAITANPGTTLVFQPAQTPVKPATPTGLTAATPTKGAPVLSWNSVSLAAHYNIYRNGSLIGSSAQTTFTDTTATTSATYSYTVTAVSAGGVESDPSTAFAVVVDKTNPTITYTVTPTPNPSGWNSTSVVVAFQCSDNITVASCSGPMTLSQEGSGQTVVGTAKDEVGNTASVTATVNIDRTAPTVGNPSLQIKWFNQTTNFSVSANDTLSGVRGGEYFYDTDPGVGHGAPMSYANSKLTGVLDAHIPIGIHRLFVRSQDVAGNWSTTSQTLLIVLL